MVFLFLSSPGLFPCLCPCSFYLYICMLSLSLLSLPPCPVLPPVLPFLSLLTLFLLSCSCVLFLSLSLSLSLSLFLLFLLSLSLSFCHDSVVPIFICYCPVLFFFLCTVPCLCPYCLLYVPVASASVITILSLFYLSLPNVLSLLSWSHLLLSNCFCPCCPCP
jgi:hypothetical protein